MNRKEFIRTSAAACAVVFVGGGLLESCQKKSLTAADANFTIDLSKSSNSALNNVGGSVTQNDVIVIRTASAMSADSFTALSSVCTHAGCTVGYDKSATRLVCPCHGGVFNLSGDVISRPPTSALRKYNTSLNGEILTIS